MRLIQINEGLGDHIALAGACNYIARRDGGLIIAGRPPYFESLYRMFTGPNIIIGPRNMKRLDEFQRYSQGRYSDEVVMSVLPYMIADHARFYNIDNCNRGLLIDARTARCPDQIDIDHYSHIYRDMLQIDRQEQWRSSPLIDNPNRYENQTLWPDTPYAFIHECTERGYLINRRYVGQSLEIMTPTPDIWSNILTYCSAIENAAEVHCIDSCFFHLTELLQPRGKLYYHRYTRPYTSIWMDYYTRHQWEIIP